MNMQQRLIRSIIAIALLLQATAGFLAAQTAQADDAQVQVSGDEFWDNRFALPGVEGGQISAIAVGENGDIFIGGYFTEAGNTEANHIARWDGHQFQALGSGVDNAVTALAISGNDLYVVGKFSTAGSVSAGTIARWNGTEWSTVGTGQGVTDSIGGQGYLYAATIYQGKLIIGGDFDLVDGVPAQNIAAWDGTQWAALGAGIHGPDEWSQAEVRSLLAVGSNLYAGGVFEIAGAAAANSIARWNGSAWSALGSGVQFAASGNTDPGTVMALAYGDNTLYAGGEFNRAGGKAANYVARYSGDQWNALGAGLTVRQYTSFPPVQALLYTGGVLYVGGDFTGAGGQPIDVIAAWDGTSWGDLAGGTANEEYDTVYALAAAPAGLVTGGNFRVMSDKLVWNVALLAGGEWTALGQGVSTDFGDSPGKPYALASDDAGNIYVGGDFTRLGGVPAKNIGMWDGTRWHNLGDADDDVLVLALGDGLLFAGGNFTQIGGIAASHVAVMDLASGQWSALGNGINGEVNALVYSDGILYAGGAFKSAGNVTAEDVAWWDGAWHPFEGQYRIFEVGKNGSEVGTFVNALAVVGNEVYIGGHFQTIQFGTNTQDLSSFVVVHNVVSWNKATQGWGWVGTGADPGVTTNGFSGFGTDVHALAIVGNSLFVGGAFNKAGGQAVSGLARWDRAAEQWISIEGSLGGAGFDDIHVRGLAPAGADLLVAGKFTSAGAAPARYVARFDTTTNQWSALGSGLRWYSDAYTQANVVLASAGGVYVGGEFDQAGGKASLGFARWTGNLGEPNLTPDQGATLQVEGVQVTFPAQAVAEASLVTLARSDQLPAAPPAGYAALYSVQAAITTMSGQQLSRTLQPYTVQAAYTDAQLAAAGISDPATLQLLRWDGAAWQPIMTGVDTQNKVVSGATDQLQPLVLVGAGGSLMLYLPAIAR